MSNNTYLQVSNYRDHHLKEILNTYSNNSNEFILRSVLFDIFNHLCVFCPDEVDKFSKYLDLFNIPDKEESNEKN